MLHPSWFFPASGFGIRAKFDPGFPVSLWITTRSVARKKKKLLNHTLLKTQAHVATQNNPSTWQSISNPKTAQDPPNPIGSM